VVLVQCSCGSNACAPYQSRLNVWKIPDTVHIRQDLRIPLPQNPTNTHPPPNTFSSSSYTLAYKRVKPPPLSDYKNVDIRVHKLRQGKLNSQLIITARIDFQIFLKISDFRLNTATIWCFCSTPSSAVIEGHGLGHHKAFLVLCTSLKSE
jgi:hypothetical protein